MRIVLATMGVEEFSLLHSACESAGHTPVAYVYSRSMRPRQSPDRYALDSIGRITEALPPAVDFLLPADARGLGRALTGYQADLLVIYGFNWILPPSVFTLPRFGTINIHASMLPRYRGPAPVLWALRNGDPDIGVTVHRIDEGVDTGPVLEQRGGIPLDDESSFPQLRLDLLPVIRDLLTTALAKVASGEQGEPQPSDGGPRATRLEPEFSVVDWSHSARDVHNQVRMFRFIGSATAPVANLGGRWLRLVRTSLTPTGGQRVECGDGPIWITESVPADPPVIPA